MSFGNPQWRNGSPAGRNIDVIKPTGGVTGTREELVFLRR